MATDRDKLTPDSDSPARRHVGHVGAKCQCCDAKNRRTSKLERKELRRLTVLENSVQLAANASCDDPQTDSGVKCRGSSSPSTASCADSLSDGLCIGASNSSNSQVRNIPVPRKYATMRQRLRTLLLTKQRELSDEVSHSLKTMGSVADRQVDNKSIADSLGQPATSSESQQQHQLDYVSVTKSKNDLAKLAEYIEGKSQAIPVADTDSAKKERRALKKERQKRERMERWRAQREADELRRAAEEEARLKKLAEEEVRRRQEYARKKKSAKKEAQRAKRQAAKTFDTDKVSCSTSGPNEVGKLQLKPVDVQSGLESLISRQQQELESLQRLHREQFEEQIRKLKEEAVRYICNVQSTGDQNTTSRSDSQHTDIDQKLSKKQIKKLKKKKRNLLLLRHQQAAESETSGTSSQGVSEASSSVCQVSTPIDHFAPSQHDQIKIRRKPDGSVEFIKLSCGLSSTVGPPSRRATEQSQPEGPDRKPPSQPKSRPETLSGKSGLSRQLPNSSAPPSSQMLTIRRISDPINHDQQTVTITAKDVSSKSSRDKLLYTLVNGRVIGADGSVGLPSGSECSPLHSATNSGALPISADGKIDLDRLDLPPGITISKVHNQSSSFLPNVAKYVGCGDQKSGPVSSSVDEVDRLRSDLDKLAVRGANELDRRDRGAHLKEDGRDTKQVLIRNVNGRTVILPVE